MVLFKFLTDVVEQLPLVEKSILWLTNNYALIVAILTLGGLVINTINNSLKAKKTNLEIKELKEDNKVSSKIVYENQVLSVEKLDLVEKKIDKFLDLNEKNLNKTEEIIQLVVLALQTANIPITSKNEFLKALNNLGGNDIKNVINVVKTHLNKENEQVEVKNNELEKEIEKLEKM